jgi:hypothetical protein
MGNSFMNPAETYQHPSLLCLRGAEPCRTCESAIWAAGLNASVDAKDAKGNSQERKGEESFFLSSWRPWFSPLASFASTLVFHGHGH